MITGYIYYSDGRREVATQSTGSDEGTRKQVEQSTARLFEFRVKTTPKWSNSKPTRFDVH